MLLRTWCIEIFIHYWQECKLLQPLWKQECSFLKDLDIEIRTNLDHSWVYIKRLYTLQQKYLHSYVHRDSIHNSKQRDIIQMLTDKK